MTEQIEYELGEQREQLAAYMVDMYFGLPEQGVDYSRLMSIDETLQAFCKEYGDIFGLVSIGAHLSIPDSRVQATAHFDGFRSDAEAIVLHVTGIVEDHGLAMPVGLPEYTIQAVALPEAS